MKIIALIVIAMLMRTYGFSQTTLVTDNFADRSKFNDNSLLLLWGGNATPVSGFSIGPKADNNSLNYNAISLTASAQSNSGYTSASSLKTATCIDYPLPAVIDRTGQNIKIEFDAIWDVTGSGGENGRLVVTLLGDYPAGGAAFDEIYDTALSDPFGKPLYNVRIRNNTSAGNGPLMLYGAGTNPIPEWEIYAPGPWWLPGFSVQAGGGSPGSGPDYPGSGTKKVATSIVSTTQWKHYTWLIKPERMELYYRNSNQTAASDVLVFFMQVPKNTSDPYVISEINTAHGTSISTPPPNYQWFQYANAVRFYWRGINNTYLANVFISRSSATLPLDQLEALIAKVNNHSVKLQGLFSIIYPENKIQIEHSTDGENFNSLGLLPYNSIGNKSFEYEHMSPSPGINFYRLKIIDKDQTFTYSKIVTAYVNDMEAEAGVYYRGKGSSVIAFNKTTYPAKLSIFQSDGRQLLSQTLTGSGSSTIFITKPDIYFYSIMQNDKWLSRGKILIR